MLPTRRRSCHYCREVAALPVPPAPVKQSRPEVAGVPLSVSLFWQLSRVKTLSLLRTIYVVFFDFTEANIVTVEPTFVNQKWKCFRLCLWVIVDINNGTDISCQGAGGSGTPTPQDRHRASKACRDGNCHTRPHLWWVLGSRVTTNYNVLWSRAKRLQQLPTP